MKKKTMYLFFIALFVALLVVNVFVSTTTTLGKKPDLALVQLEARADDPGEVDPPDDEFPPTRPSTNKGALSAIINFFF